MILFTDNNHTTIVTKILILYSISYLRIANRHIDSIVIHVTGLIAVI